MTRIGRHGWLAPTGGALALGALVALPALIGSTGVDTASAAEAHLERFTSCASLTRWAQENARTMVGPYGLGGGPVVVHGGVAALTAEDAATAPAAASTAKAPGTDFSTTNVQEAGIDEPDIVKTDGDRIFAIARNRLYAVDVSGPAPRIAGTLTLPPDRFIRDMLLSGDRLLVMSDGGGGVRPRPAGSAPGTPEPAIAKFPVTGDMMIAPATAGATLTEVDVTDPAAMTVIESLETEARYVTARLSGTTARVVLTSSPTVQLAFPTEPGAAAEGRALVANRNALARTTADDWLPRARITTAAGTSAPGPLVPCDAVSRPRAFSGLDTLTVLTLDLTHGVTPIDTDAVVASGDNVYASDRALYVATNRWAAPDAAGGVPGETTTQIHKFDTSGTSATEYRGSGSVRGTLLNQFAMSEDDGNLRVATTADGQFVVGDDAVVKDPGAGASESYVTVLAERDGELRQVGQVGGLGKGERIYAVRFIGKRGYVVTFRQTDPLYVVDLSDATRPRVAGELKIAGYSAYLHPIADDLLIGVGQDATAEGRRTGLQVSLFDVSDPASPRRLQQGLMPGASSEAEWDHHAFLWWAKRSLAVIPFTRYDFGGPEPAGGGSTGSGSVAVGPVSGALAMTVTRQAIAEAGRVAHPDDPQYGAGVRRSLVIGDTLYTVSDAGLGATALDGFADRGWLPFS